MRYDCRHARKKKGKEYDGESDTFFVHLCTLVGIVWRIGLVLVVAQVSEGDYLTGLVLMLTSLICHIFTFSELNHAFDLLATIKRATQSLGSMPIVSVRWSLPKYS